MCTLDLGCNAMHIAQRLDQSLYTSLPSTEPYFVVAYRVLMIPPALSAGPLSPNMKHTVDELLDLLGDAWVLHVVLQSLGVLLSILQNLSPKVCQRVP